MKLLHFKLGMAALIVAISLFNAPPVLGDETEMIDDYSYMADTCEERNSHLQEHIAFKTTVHNTLTANHEGLQARIEELLVRAVEGNVDRNLIDRLQNASLKLDELFDEVETAFEALITYWTVDACTMTEEEFAERVSHTTPIAQHFEATGRTITVYRESVVLPLVEEVTTAILTADPQYTEPTRTEPELTTP